MTKREDIFSALFAVLEPLTGTTLSRNEPLKDFPPGDVFSNLDDGETENTETFLNPPLYEFTATPMLTIAVNGDDGPTRDAALAGKVDEANQLLVAVTDLGGLITAIRVQPPTYAPSQLWAAVGIKGATIPIELDFWSTESIG